MKAMLINAYGENAVFEAAETEKPEVKAGHVLVKIAASSVNTVDTMIRNMGKELPLSPDTPAVPGMDFAGTVEEVGEGMSGYSVGDEVYGCAGGLADLPALWLTTSLQTQTWSPPKRRICRCVRRRRCLWSGSPPTKGSPVPGSVPDRKFSCTVAPAVWGTSPCN